MVRGDHITADRFSNLAGKLGRDPFLVFNDTRVVRARLQFTKSTGGAVEIFCLDPTDPAEPESAFHAVSGSAWKCLVGNSKKWKEGPVELYGEEVAGNGRQVTLQARREAPAEDGTFIIRFAWEPGELTFSEVLESLGHVPLPPYIHRDDTVQDRERYQTIYAAHDGSVAAPTAGLHFTPAVMESLRARDGRFGYVTLHVGAGTFRPVAEPEVSRHVMHSERISVTAETIRQILANRDRHLTAVGTTAARTLESLYWAGVKLIIDGPSIHPETGQWDPYLEKYDTGVAAEEALHAILGYLEAKGLDAYRGETRLMIVPGYRFRLVGGLLTNFHMPKSTLLLLVSALAGETWKEAYRYALANGFRFLSYGDACLFLPPPVH